MEINAAPAVITWRRAVNSYMPDSLVRKLALARRRWRTLLAFVGVCLAFTTLAVLCLASFYSDRVLVLTYAGRVAWLMTLGMALLIGLGVVSILVWRRKIR